MTHLSRIKLISSAMFMVIPLLSHGVTAGTQIFDFIQKDGSVIRVKQSGDEFFHFYTTEDGQPLVLDNGMLYYASISSDGKICNSNITANNKMHRQPAAESKKIMEVLGQNSYKMRNRSPLHGPGLITSSRFPASGTQKVLVVLAEYQDRKFTLKDPTDYFNRLLNEKDFSDYGGTGSAKDYFIECSNGQFLPDFDVYGPVLLDHNTKYYGGNNWFSQDEKPYLMAVEACQKLDDSVDFSQYDRDGDGYIDNVFIFYAGIGEATGGDPDAVWPHAGYVSAIDKKDYTFDGVRLDRYGCTNEWVEDRPDGIGIFCHEFCHVLGLPDLYSTVTNEPFHSANWSLMTYGAHNNNGRTPTGLCSFERYALDWLTPTPIKRKTDVTLKTISENEAYIINAGRNEYYLLENRQQEGWDKYLPGHGMVIWHVDFDESLWNSNNVNNDPEHQNVDLVEADGILDEDTRSGDTFPGTAGITEFTDSTSPSMKNWSGQRLNLPITEITETDGVITFKVSGGSGVSSVSNEISLSDECNVIASGHDITVESDTPLDVLISDIYGRIISLNSKMTGTQTIHIPDDGVYIVKAGSSIYRIILK